MSFHHALELALPYLNSQILEGQESVGIFF